MCPRPLPRYQRRGIHCHRSHPTGQTWPLEYHRGYWTALQRAKSHCVVSHPPSHLLSHSTYKHTASSRRALRASHSCRGAYSILRTSLHDLIASIESVTVLSALWDALTTCAPKMLPRPDLSLMQKACMMILAQGPGGHGGSQAEKLMPRYWSAIARLPYGRADLEQWCHHFRWLGMQHENTMSRDPLLESHSRTGIDSGFSTPYREQIIPAATPCTVTTDLQCEHNEHPDDHTHANQRKRPDQEPAERCDHKPRLTKIQARTQPC